MAAHIQVLLVKPLIVGDIGIAGHCHHRLLLHRVDLEDLMEMVHQDRLRAHIGAWTARQFQNGRSRLRHAHNAQQMALPVPQQRRGIERLVLQVRKRMAGINDLGREQRADIFPVVGLYILLLRSLERPVGHIHHAPKLQSFAHAVIHTVPPANHGTHGFIDQSQLLGRRVSALIVQCLRIQHGKIQQAPHPDHKKFIEIAAENGQKAKTLHQRHRLIRRLFQYPLVKFQPAQLPVLGIAQVPISL